VDLGTIRCDDVDWIHVTQNRDQWRAFVNTVMNLRVPQKVEECFNYLSDC